MYVRRFLHSHKACKRTPERLLSFPIDSTPWQGVVEVALEGSLEECVAIAVEVSVEGCVELPRDVPGNYRSPPPAVDGGLFSFAHNPTRVTALSRKIDPSRI